MKYVDGETVLYTVVAGVLMYAIGTAFGIATAAIIVVSIIYLIGYCWGVNFLWELVFKYDQPWLVPPTQSSVFKMLTLTYALFWPLIWAFRCWVRAIQDILDGLDESSV